MGKETLMEVEKRVNGEVTGVHALPCGKRRPTENHFTAVKNLLKTRLRVDCDAVSIVAGNLKYFEREVENDNKSSGKRDSVEVTRKRNVGYPNLKSIRRSTLVRVELENSATLFMDNTFTALASHKGNS